MTTEQIDFEKFLKKTVFLHYVPEGESDMVEREGTVEAASMHGLAFKEKGRRDVELVMPDAVVEIRLAPTKPKTLAQKTLKAVNLTNVRQHMLDRHGLTRDEANAMSDEDAWDAHDKIDHDPLGHKHKSDEDDDEGEDSGEE